MSEESSAVVDMSQTEAPPVNDNNIIIPPIDNNNIKGLDVVLLDISIGKKWIAYITQPKISNNTESAARYIQINNQIDAKPTYHLTIRRFTELGPKNADLHKNQHFSLNITKLIEDGGDMHCKFLSVSPDGKYIALSFIERNKDSTGKIKQPNNPNCLIFKVEDGRINYNCKRIKFQGRAVFLTKKNDDASALLALINLNTIEVYDKFWLNIGVPSYCFDLKTPGSSGQFLSQSKPINRVKPCISTGSWMSVGGGKTDNVIDRLVAYTRHIRQNIIVMYFCDNRIIRIWSITEDGSRLTCIPANFNVRSKQVVAVSEDRKYIVIGLPSIYIYDLQTGLVACKLESTSHSVSSSDFVSSHFRFCYDSRYVAMVGVTLNPDGKNSEHIIVFEIWCIETGQSILRKQEPYTNFDVDFNMSTPAPSTFDIGQFYSHKSIQPFIIEDKIKDQNGSSTTSLKAFCTTKNSGSTSGNPVTELLVLDIDEYDRKKGFKIEWKGAREERGKPLCTNKKLELTNGLDEYKGLKCGIFKLENQRYLLRFGQHMVQLWRLRAGVVNNEYIKEDDVLIYIRAYKAPHYNLAHSFKETWMLHDADSIKFVGGNSPGRIIVTITKGGGLGDDCGPKMDYHTEEILLPFKRSASSTSNSDSVYNYNYHHFESACQALHYLHIILNDFTEITRGAWEFNNRNYIYKKTWELVKTTLDKLEYSHYFTSMAGSRTLAMLASFNDGKEIIKQILSTSKTISVLSYTRSIRKPKKNKENKDYDGDQGTGNQSPLLNPQSRKPIQYRASTAAKSTEHQNKYNKVETSKASNENVLTILLKDEWDYSLYNVLLNRVILDSKELGPGCLSALTDVLLFLQEDENTDLLLSTIEKLSYLDIKEEKLGLTTYELNTCLGAPTRKGSSFRNLDSFAAIEELKMSSTLYTWIIFNPVTKLFFDTKAKTSKGVKKVTSKVYSLLLPITRTRYFHTAVFWCSYLLRVLCFLKGLFPKSGNQEKEIKRLSTICVVPLPHFDFAATIPGNQPLIRINEQYGHNVLDYMKSNAFLESNLSDDYSNDLFRKGDTLFNVLLDYKWRKFSRWRFWFMICPVHAVYYISYSTGVLFPQEVYGYIPGSSSVKDNSRHMVSIVLMVAMGLVLIWQECRQVYYTRKRIYYFWSGYNWVDILAFIFPMVTLLQMICNWNYLTEVSSITTLILWTHGIIRLRVLSFVGVTLEIIIQLSINVAGLLFIMLLVIFAFTNSFMVLLRQQGDEYFQEAYNGTTSSAQLDSVTVIQDISSSNNFNNVYKSFIRVWFFTYGVWDPISGGDAGDDKMIMALSVIFSLVTILIFFNLIIALMSSTAEEVRKKGDRAWVNHFSSVIAEIELLWFWDASKHTREKNPSYLYYAADYGTVKRHERRLIKEMKELQETFRPE